MAIETTPKRLRRRRTARWIGRTKGDMLPGADKERGDLTVGEIPFMPGMNEDIWNRVMKVLLERDEDVWKFKGHWYKCAATRS